MQHKTTQHKHRTLCAVKKSNKAAKNKNDKGLYNNNDEKILCSLSPNYL